MILKWGGYAHEQDECSVKITYQSIYDQFGRNIGVFHLWDIIGWIKGTSQSDITTKLQSLEEAYASDYKDLILYLNDGTTETRHKLQNANTFGGTHVLGFGYMDGPWKMGVEYANRRTFWAKIRGEVRVGWGIYQWRERLEVKGFGGTKWRFIPQVSGAPQMQTLQTDTPFFYIQQGRAVGFLSYPVAPAALFPTHLHNEMSSITYETPVEQRVNGDLLYPIEWLYVMEATASQNGTPNPIIVSLF